MGNVALVGARNICDSSVRPKSGLTADIVAWARAATSTTRARLVLATKPNTRAQLLHPSLLTLIVPPTAPCVATRIITWAACVRPTNSPCAADACQSACHLHATDAHCPANCVRAARKAPRVWLTHTVALVTRTRPTHAAPPTTHVWPNSHAQVMCVAMLVPPYQARTHR
jgi:hypothetical protein